MDKNLNEHNTLIKKQRANVSGQNSEARVLHLPATLEGYEWRRILLEDFKSKSAIYNFELNGDEFIGHFIPLSWGHGGTYKGNLIPVNGFENMRLSNRNPLKYIKEPRNHPTIKYLAEQNELTTDEYISFVNWCDKNRRTRKECRAYIGTYSSIDVWKSQRSRN
ncbi:hypothetical protein [Paenibacillus sp. ISL-20]|uniref:hypothetical protein n=1 Tax=Paenibacillus sp. ISL-20 TaxID=2819163 RepID=UPI001BE85995|nr:hypothetical protein [Paenibacillus sp. ISL-20]MBT2764292.1 hypothetical protein [Paenibacillus sp. ISL-20]